MAFTVKAIFAPIIVLFLIVGFPFWVTYGILNFVYGIWLNYRFCSRYAVDGKHILFVYSESPNWQKYIEENILPKIDGKAVFLNWSKRAEWKESEPLEAKILSHWGGQKEFNPMAVVFLSGFRT